ncbi:gamma-glutamylcyclotransferase family protein [Photobacterium atrarenae]|uniref:Gamma-glutamylcyclotransferase family protein n=1 Tax=Photobacterium atrarenae TaxID=865757 RepID=A0ABY5GFT4_9GAMM|nr:gamma-glutamylcyclotransferase [Photobacterium atrarenae]UTV27462.1 gamma-glutamylcyclotransferase [Photobacterium atrarenae]
MEKVFVYGTLRAGQSNHRLLRQALLLGRCQLPCGYLLYDFGGYPGAVRQPAGSALVGEVYEVDSVTFAALDVLEEYPAVYTREQIETDFGLAWIYLYVRSVAGLPVIAHGDWCQR